VSVSWINSFEEDLKLEISDKKEGSLESAKIQRLATHGSTTPRLAASEVASVFLVGIFAVSFSCILYRSSGGSFSAALSDSPHNASFSSVRRRTVELLTCISKRITDPFVEYELLTVAALVSAEAEGRDRELPFDAPGQSMYLRCLVDQAVEPLDPICLLYDL